MAGVGEADSGVSQPANTVVAFASYNVGIQNAEILGKHWNKTGSSKQARLKNDIAAIFAPQHGIQVLFLSEFGQMTPNIDSELIEKRGEKKAALNNLLRNFFSKTFLSNSI